jgi:hypothetical protein
VGLLQRQDSSVIYEINLGSAKNIYKKGGSMKVIISKELTKFLRENDLRALEKAILKIKNQNYFDFAVDDPTKISYYKNYERTWS